ncbi:hypothetical protein IGJ39_000309 [Enterococcus sp. AZ140]|uniref:Uncharacterized protein n=1 Tax=Enterococcus mundtii TaxID=53346 RepID=A0A2S7RT50_ENTMU|nr:hypothetical protein CUS89_09160 [Enterococcus mundtii]
MKMIHYVKVLIVGIGLLIFYGIFMLVLPFLIQERLLFFLTVFILVSTIYNGKIYSTKKVKYKIIFDKDDR